MTSQDEGDAGDSSRPRPEVSFRPILPAQPTSDGPRVPSGPQRPLKPPRQPVLVACLQCRKRKVKCTGTRPVCFRCSSQGLDCEWDTEPDTTRLKSLRRRNEELEKENEDLREFISFLYSRPRDEALEIFNWLRSTGNALQVLELVRVGDMLLNNQSDNASSSHYSGDNSDSTQRDDGIDPRTTGQSRGRWQNSW
ncbi:Nitrogen assimilation transcription factor nirA 5 [Colletotrichum musicola]|uniref:Nitrogen assimilation transcription factor nirA 5 n=1 Tax=Colletotrichum musicola TaxID=2175873 RepID=A0A8H6K3R3_9PEZI|nr:Nitrogen assimilation transcription factor nirA 5 [Colletotrichum musicola]